MSGSGSSSTQSGQDILNSHVCSVVFNNTVRGHTKPWSSCVGPQAELGLRYPQTGLRPFLLTHCDPYIPKRADTILLRMHQHITVFTLNIWTPILITIFVLRFDQVHFTPADVSRTPGWVANSLDPDQTPRSAASDLGLDCLLRHVCPNT